tara:strand:- start:207 stop:515 length:309 start_codon:yes stop_codon:yes gene_type:complete
LSFFSSANAKLPFVLVVTASLLLVGCGPPDTLPYSEYDEITVSVYGYTPKDEEYYLGDTVGASSCGSIAHSWAERNGFRSSSNWGYVCCTHEDGSKCYRKIR